MLKVEKKRRMDTSKLVSVHGMFRLMGSIQVRATKGKIVET